MTDPSQGLFDAIDSLLDAVDNNTLLPAPAERVRLREAAGLTEAAVAQALGVRTQSIQAWEAGRAEPKGQRLEAYRKLLDGLTHRFPAPADTSSATPAGKPQQPDAAPEPTQNAPEPVAPQQLPSAAELPQTAFLPDGLVVQGDHQPCIRCGMVTPFKATDGRSLHPGAMCQPRTATPPTTPPQYATPPAPDATLALTPDAAAPPARITAAAPQATTAPAQPSPTPAPVPSRPQRRAKSAARAQAETHTLITHAVDEELQRTEGDTEAALKALIKRAIPDVMTMFEETRATARYQFTAYPALPDILKKPSKREPDQIWEARPAFHHPDFSLKLPGSVQVTALDANAAYLSALKCWLPIGKLEHTTGADGVDPKRSGVHLITPAPWHHPHLPNPLGDRDTDGALWITDATLRLLSRLAGPKYGLTDAPEIHESWTSGATENFLDALRKILTAAREKAIEEDDTITTEYIKAMYSKFVSTMGESIHNRDIIRPDWMHNIHSQAYANLWGKAYKAHQAGLEIIAMMGTDELHVTGDWRQVFTEGRGVTQMKIKHSDAKASGEYTLGKAPR
ncbi:multiprotein-bridging factor 1 family protein [Streptomyces sp. NPDC059080]|uniref:helix-turn-helix domain-containing protein n=1 Tax=Streptomyces sp. NPDC059080 TaxID=3346718 RepID=UPI00369EC507